MEDYPIYGVTPEELERIGCLAHLSLPELREAVHSVPDAILVQAHPYRGYLHCMPAGLLDGVEVCNENPATTAITTARWPTPASITCS